MKKILWFLAKTGLLHSALLLLIYPGFRLNEYLVGNKFVKYLEKNKLESVSINDSIPLHFDHDFFNNQLYLVGEVHEVESSPIIDVSMFKYLNQNNAITTYVAELDISQAYYLNKYLKDSTNISLKEILKKWSVLIGQNSTEYRENKWKRLKVYYQQLDSFKKFTVHGVDRLQDFELLYRLLQEKIPAKYANEIPQNKDSIINWASANLPEILQLNMLDLQDSLLLSNIVFNCKNWSNIHSRDEFMYKNLKRYYQQNQWKNTKIYGCFGLYHALQGCSHSFAGRIKENSFLNGQMVSLMESYANSYLTLPSQALPSFLADKGRYTRLSYSYDNLFLFYIKGIEDYKRVSNNHSISLFKLDAKYSPYSMSNRGLYNFSLLPIFGSIPIAKAKATTDYAQYVFFVNGANCIKVD